MKNRPEEKSPSLAGALVAAGMMPGMITDHVAGPCAAAELYAKHVFQLAHYGTATPDGRSARYDFIVSGSAPLASAHVQVKHVALHPSGGTAGRLTGSASVNLQTGMSGVDVMPVFSSPFGGPFIGYALLPSAIISMAYSHVSESRGRGEKTRRNISFQAELKDGQLRKLIIGHNSDVGVMLSGVSDVAIAGSVSNPQG